MQRIYLDELGTPNQQPIGINLMQLTIASEKAMAEQAKQLIEWVQLGETGTLAKNEIIDIITTIAVYKFSSLSREEVEEGRYEPEELEKLINREEIINRALTLILPGESS